MNIKSLSFSHYRNYELLTLSPHHRLNVVMGPNAQGKTNLLEAIYVMAVGMSFRAHKEAELLRWKDDWFRLDSQFQVEDSGRLLSFSYVSDGAKKRKLSLNGVQYRRWEDLPERLQVVLFTPDDLNIVKGSPERRRRFLDMELSTLLPGFSTLCRNYRRTLYQRNELLKDVRARRVPADDLAVWDEALSQYGAHIIYERLRLLHLLVPQARRIHTYMTKQSASFDITYQSSLGTAVLGMNESDLKARFLDHLIKKRAEEINRGVTLVGPHRDDLVIYENKNDLRTYGSQGQQRTAVLALKLSEIEAFRRLYGRAPILLLDDVMSELDQSRQDMLLHAVVHNDMQTFLTTTHLTFTTSNQPEKFIFSIKEGKIISSD